MEPTPAIDLIRRIEMNGRAHEDFAVLSLWLADWALKGGQLRLHPTAPGECWTNAREGVLGADTNADECKIQIGTHTLALTMETIRIHSSRTSTNSVTIVVRHQDRDVPVLSLLRRFVADLPGGYLPRSEPWPWTLVVRPRTHREGIELSGLVDFVTTVDDLPLTHIHARHAVLRKLAETSLPGWIELRDVNEAIICLLAALNALSGNITGASR